MIFPATTVSFSIRSPSLAKDTSSPASEARSLFKIGEKGGSLPNAAIARSDSLVSGVDTAGAEVVSTIPIYSWLSDETRKYYRPATSRSRAGRNTRFNPVSADAAAEDRAPLAWRTRECADDPPASRNGALPAARRDPRNPRRSYLPEHPWP